MTSFKIRKNLRLKSLSLPLSVKQMFLEFRFQCFDCVYIFKTHNTTMNQSISNTDWTQNAISWLIGNRSYWNACTVIKGKLNDFLKSDVNLFHDKFAVTFQWKNPLMAFLSCHFFILFFIFFHFPRSNKRDTTKTESVRSVKTSSWPFSMRKRCENVKPMNIHKSFIEILKKSCWFLYNTIANNWLSWRRNGKKIIETSP